MLQHIPNGSGRRGLLAGPCSAPKVKPTPSCNGGGLTVAVGGDAGTRCSRRSCVQAAAPGINLRRVVRSVRSRWCQGLMLYQVLRPAGREGSWDAEAPVHGISREHPRKVGCPVLQRCSRCGPQPPCPGSLPPAAAPGQDAALHGAGLGEAPSASLAVRPLLPSIPSLGPRHAWPRMSSGTTNGSRPV